MALVTGTAKRVRALAGFEGVDQFRRRARQVIDFNPFTAGQAHQQELVVRRAEHVRRHGAGLAAPFEGLGQQIHHHQLVAVLHGGVNHRAFAVDPQVAGGLAGGNALGQGERAAVPAVNIHMVEPVSDRDKPFHVRREAQLVGVQNAGHGALHFGRFGVQKQERVTQGIGNHQRLLVGREVHVVRLFAGGNAFALLPQAGVNHADAGVLRIEHKNGRRGRCAPDHRTGQAQQQGKQKTRAGAGSKNHKKPLIKMSRKCSRQPSARRSERSGQVRALPYHRQHDRS